MIQNILKGNYGIEKGALFRRNVGGAMTEIAEVIEIAHDRMGIPHVRYNAHLMRGHYKASAEEQRTLSLESFTSRYRERVQGEQKA